MATLPEQHKPKTPFSKNRRTVSPNQPVYSKTRWGEVSKEFRKKNPICAWYGKRISEKYPCRVKSKITDHIVGMTDGGDKWDSRNFQALCASCSQAKTSWETQNRTYHNGKKTITPNGLV